MKLFFRALFLISIAIININCKKSKPSDTLPPVTQSGANTFGCKINGVVWVPYSKCEDFTDPCREISTYFISLNGNSFLPLSFVFGSERKIGNNDSYLTIKTMNFGQ